MFESGVQKLCPDSEIWVYRKHCEDQYGERITEYQKGVLMGLDIALGFFRSSWEANRFSPNASSQWAAPTTSNSNDNENHE